MSTFGVFPHGSGQSFSIYILQQFMIGMFKSRQLQWLGLTVGSWNFLSDVILNHETQIILFGE